MSPGDQKVRFGHGGITHLLVQIQAFSCLFKLEHADTLWYGLILIGEGATGALKDQKSGL